MEDEDGDADVPRRPKRTFFMERRRRPKRVAEQYSADDHAAKHSKPDEWAAGEVKLVVDANPRGDAMEDEDGDADVPRRLKRPLSFSEVKLVVWDLDGTLWRGVLDEGPIAVDETAASLVRALASRGIINSVCSKNDRPIAEHALQAAGLLQYFVANEISFDLEKGLAVRRILSTLGLLAPSSLFIDDSARERAAVRHANEGVQLADPSALSMIARLVGRWGRPDPELTRLRQCRVLEKKTQSLGSSTGVDAFLRDSRIRARITPVGTI